MGRANLAIVVIGRNEGSRLEASLGSVGGSGFPVLYVDSASSDGSPEVAARLGADVLELGAEEPLTAARSRNAGFMRVREVCPDAAFVQFVDGDSLVEDGWLVAGVEFLTRSPDAGIVAGTVREAHRDASVYNRLLDMEWKGPTGEVRSVGGIFMARADAFERAGGLDPEIIAGEEADLGRRVRAAGYSVHRLPVPMARHDAAMTRFSQWWRRALRSGHAYAEASARSAGADRGPEARQVRSYLLWGAVVPLLLVVALAVSPFVPLALAPAGIAVLGYVVLSFRVARYRRRLGDAPADARLYAAFCILAKLPQSFGWVLFRANRLRRRRTGLIDKRPDVRREVAR